MQISSVNSINNNSDPNIFWRKTSKLSNKVSFEGIVRPSKLLKTNGSLVEKFRVLWIDTKRNYNMHDFENSGRIKSKTFLKNPLLREVFDFFELKLKNTHKVSDKYFRGGILTCEYDILRLKRKGVTDIINLIDSAKFDPKLADFAKKQGINYHRIELLPPYGIPNKKQIDQFFNVIDTSKGAVYTHCLHGKDRTGIMTFMYEVEKLNKPKHEAVKNMLNCGLHAKKNPFMIEFLAKRYPSAAESIKKTVE
jgi:protein tyrosine/serine phosphatase